MLIRAQKVENKVVIHLLPLKKKREGRRAGEAERGGLSPPAFLPLCFQRFEELVPSFDFAAVQ